MPASVSMRTSRNCPAWIAFTFVIFIFSSVNAFFQSTGMRFPGAGWTGPGQADRRRLHNKKFSARKRTRERWRGVYAAPPLCGATHASTACGFARAGRRVFPIMRNFLLLPDLLFLIGGRISFSVMNRIAVMPMNRAQAAFVLAGWLAFGLSGHAFAQWITFSGSPPQSPAAGEARDTGYGSTPVRGYLSLPVDRGRHPAVVILPSCEGRKLYHQSWARALSERGFVALVVDDYFMHDRDRTCGILDPAIKADVLRLRLLHALGAANYLSARTEVDSARLAVMGWGDAPVGVLLGGAEDVDWQQKPFRAGVVVTPDGCYGQGQAPSLPTLVLHSGSGAAGPGGACNAPADNPSLEVRIYEGTQPGFDDPRAVLDPGPGSASAETAGRRYDRLAHIRAIKDVAGFLERRLPPGAKGGGHDYAAASAPAISEVGAWAVDPGVPGPDLPPAGGSAFDAVFSRAGPSGAVYDVPYPFPRLLQRLEYAAGGETMSRSPLDSTLIPLGRSLQREAAAPDYFQSPRIVVAVTGEPASGEGPLGIRLKHRLFLGYQPRSNVVEIISYNAPANRFEFQVVRDYAAGQKPRVGYAPRALCTSCHHNAGPIFADAGWDETTANDQVARRLDGLGAQFHGVPMSAGDRAASAIDAATDDANLLSVYQRLWSEGCASAHANEIARCRAGAFQAMLQYRLSNSAGFDRTAALYSRGYLALQRRNWAQRWPDGLLIPNPNLPNRAPLMSPSPSAVSVALDPLRPRPPVARWESTSDRALERLIRGLSHALPAEHMTLLDRTLRGTGEPGPARSLATSCEVLRRGLAGRSRRFQIECGTRPAAGAGFYLQAELQVTPDGSVSGEAGWLEIGSGTYARRAMAGRLGRGEAGNRIAMRFAAEDGETTVRAPDGNALLGFTLVWDPEVADSATRFEATGTFTIGDDFRPVVSTLERIAAGPSATSPLLADRFDGVRLSDWLLAELGVRPAARCCGSGAMPAPRLDLEDGPTESILSSALAHRGPLQTLHRYCGACHGSDTAYPPGFLNGGSETLQATVAHCAERIYYRLSMWHRRPEHQVVTPMPPVQGLSLARTTTTDWRKSESLERLIAYARDLLIGQGRDPGELLASDYRAARSCLAERNRQTYAVTR
jgi:dienelactone hydrolase